MLKKIFIFILFGLVLTGLPLRAEMANGRFGLDEVAENAEFKEKDKTTPPAALFDTVNKVVSGLLALTAILFFGLITYAGARWMTARGNEEFATKAKDTIEAAVIGLIIVAAAYAITNFIFARLWSEAPPDARNKCAVLGEADCKDQIGECAWSERRQECLTPEEYRRALEEDAQDVGCTAQKNGSCQSYDCAPGKEGIRSDTLCANGGWCCFAQCFDTVNNCGKPCAPCGVGGHCSIPNAPCESGLQCREGLCANW